MAASPAFSPGHLGPIRPCSLSHIGLLCVPLACLVQTSSQALLPERFAMQVSASVWFKAQTLKPTACV